MVLVHEPMCIYMCDVLCPFEHNCDDMLLLADVQDTCASLPVLLYLLIQAIPKSTVSIYFDIKFFCFSVGCCFSEYFPMIYD